jgi:Ca-activated chloride channel family protein
VVRRASERQVQNAPVVEGEIMAKRCLLFFLTLLIVLSGFAVWLAAQDREKSSNVIRVLVSMVQLNVAVTDRSGNYVTNLSPSDFVISEDGIPQTLATFEQGYGGPRNVVKNAQEHSKPARPPGSALRSGLQEGSPEEIGSAVTGADVFILFDTSNFMYQRRGFAFAQDAIADFVRSLDDPNRVAFYSYSRDLYRATSLTSDRLQVLRGVRETVNGDDAALYNALLLTLKDASQYPGRKVVVAFSNGPDNYSMVAPEDVDELAQSEGIPIYLISTREARLDAATAAVFERMSDSTGGEVYYAKSWRDERKAFALIREDLAHLYYLSYYPQPNPNRGWRSITVKLAGQKSKQYTIRTRSGYRPIQAHLAADPAASLP